MTTCNLVSQKERFWIPAFAAEFERAKVLVPRSFGGVWIGFHPEPQLVQVGEADISVVHALDQMVTNGGGKA